MKLFSNVGCKYREVNRMIETAINDRDFDEWDTEVCRRLCAEDAIYHM